MLTERRRTAAISVPVREGLDLHRGLGCRGPSCGALRRRGEAARVSGPKAKCPSCGTEWEGPVVFCGECGSALFSRTVGADFVGVRLGVLDDDPGIRPGGHQFTAYAAAWEQIPDDGLPRHPEAAPPPPTR